MPHSPPTTDFDDLVKISPPSTHAIMEDEKNNSTAGTGTYIRRSPNKSKTHSEDIKVKQEVIEVEEVDVQRMVEDTVRKVREQSDRSVCALDMALLRGR